MSGSKLSTQVWYSFRGDPGMLGPQPRQQRFEPIARKGGVLHDASRFDRIWAHQRVEGTLGLNFGRTLGLSQGGLRLAQESGELVGGEVAAIDRGGDARFQCCHSVPFGAGLDALSKQVSVASPRLL
jgi:hypothetical protein